MQSSSITKTVLLVFLCWADWCCAEDLLFEESFDKGLSEKWKILGLSKDDYRIREGGLELRVQSEAKQGASPMLKVDLPFKSSETVIATVEMTVVGAPLRRGAFAGLFLTDASGVSFGAKKTNIDGYFVFSPGHVEFIGKPGQEGDPGKYSIRYWPADPDAGPLRITVRDNYAYFQVGPSKTDEYKTFFHSAIRKSDSGLGFGLMAIGDAKDGEQWVRFDNFRVVRP